MSCIIDTSHRSIALFGLDPYGVSLDGFASGNFAGGILPTEISSTWCNGVQMEITHASLAYLPFALGGAGTYADLAYSIDQSHQKARPINSTNPTFTFRSQADSVLTANGQSCVFAKRTQNNFSIAAGATTNVGILAVPTNTQCLASFIGTITQTDAITTNYSQIEYRVSVRNSAGVVTVQNSAVIYSYIPGIAYVWSIFVSGANVALRCAVPALPAGKIHNAQCYSTLLNVTTGI